ncbi:MAG TPA: chemotaxis-specific protein-glutamate methyltransferase CheB [candidate division Zixibacteria bacterium]|nr:chemotaxis-specific protein-glutamate methyltransferase CheB [candidate division Zixibacteria bacterium]
MSIKLKTLIVDDTITYRTLLRTALSELDGIEVVGVASNGETALERVAQLIPDLVILDVEMPVKNGIEALAEIRESFPDVSVVMFSAASPSSARWTIEALELGAVDFIPKPTAKDQDHVAEYLERYLAPALMAIRAKHGEKTDAVVATPPPMVYPKPNKISPMSRDGFEIMVIGCSTGGPNALLQIIPALPEDLPFPILVVQHMPAGFTSSLADQLNRRSSLDVMELAEETEVIPGRVIIAPGGRHMVVRRYSNRSSTCLYACANDTPPLNNCRPAVDVTLRSVAAAAQGKVLAAILTGMGRDGLMGARALARRGEYFMLTQSASSCVVYGMPRVVDEAGLSHESVSLELIAERVAELGRERQYAGHGC